MPQLRVRREIEDLSSLDVGRLRRAFKAMKEAKGDHGYQHWAGLQRRPSPMGGSRRTATFLPWNRIYLARFEQQLARFEPGVSLPWWDWLGDSGIPEAFSVPEIGDERNPLCGSLIDLPEWEGMPAAPGSTSRSPGTANPLPNRLEVEDVLGVRDFTQFSIRLENIHNALHMWVGGTSTEAEYAFYDPFCWAYQASIDRIWWLWQRAHPEAGPPTGIADSVLAPFGMAVIDAWDASGLGYSYSEQPTFEQPRKVAPVFVPGAASDRPSGKDQLNFSDYAEAFAEIIGSEETEPPLTIGIYGSWGIGKSSLLEMIAAEFEEPEASPTPVHVVEFNAWEYNSTEKIWPGLVRRVMEEMEDRAQWSRGARLWEMVKRNVGREWQRRRAPLAVAVVSLLAVAVVAAIELGISSELILAALGALGISGVVKVVSDAATNPVSKWVATLVEGEDYGEELPYMREIRADLRFLAAKMRRDGEQPRILLMIDDLDRCEPEKAVEVLQAVNQLLDFDAFVVCLGIDARIITAAVEAHYKQLLGDAGATGYEYLDKIVQIPFRIPTPTSADIAGFLSAQMPFKREGLEAEPQGASVEINVTPPRDDGATYEVSQPPASTTEATEAAREPDARPSPTLFSQKEVDGFLLLAPYIRSNPRHIKRLINVYRMVRTLAIRRDITEILDNSATTITWIVICAQWPYSVAGMLRELRPHIEAADSNGGTYPGEPPLTFLHDACQPRLDGKLRLTHDGDPADLRAVLEETDMTWEELRVLQTFTLNFNPAIEEALLWGPTPPESFAGE